MDHVINAELISLLIKIKKRVIILFAKKDIKSSKMVLVKNVHNLRLQLQGSLVENQLVRDEIRSQTKENVPHVQIMSSFQVAKKIVKELFVEQDKRS